jgi:AraC-like DNA-binding protein
VVADLFVTGQPTLERVRQLKRSWPRLAVIMYSAITADRLHDLFDAGRSGVDVLVLPDRDDSPRALVSSIERAEAQSLTSALGGSLDGIDSTVRDAVLLSVTRAHEKLSPAGLSKLLVLPRRTMAQRFAKAGFPPPRRLLTWGRLIMAAQMLEDANRPADRVAASLGFPSGSAFRNACQRYLHSTPGEIRRRGGAVFVIRALTRHARAPAERKVGPRSSSRRHTLAL